MLKHILPLFLLSWLVPACGVPPPQATPQLISVYATSAAYPWLDEVYNCASSSVTVRLSDPSAAEMSLRLGEPVALDSPAFQIGRDDLLVVVQPQTAVGSLTLNQVRQLYSGQVTQWKDVGGAGIPVQVWTYAQAEDIQLIFDRAVMQGQPIASLARLAVSAQAMSDSVGATPGSIGILPRRWKAGNTNAVLAVSTVPVLAILASPPQGAVRDLLSCLQSKE
jgi:hypothetical protein